MRLPVRLLAAALTSLALSGCTADVSTRVDVRSGTAARVTATVTMSGQAADTVNANPSLRAQLVHVLASRTHATPSVHTGKHTLTVSAAMDYAALKGSADVLGVSAATLAGSGHQVTATLTLSDPTALREAITSGVASMTDASAVAATMISSTTLTTVVHFAGGVTTASASPRAALGDPRGKRHRDPLPAPAGHRNYDRYREPRRRLPLAVHRWRARPAPARRRDADLPHPRPRRGTQPVSATTRTNARASQDGDANPRSEVSRSYFSMVRSMSHDPELLAVIDRVEAGQPEPRRPLRSFTRRMARLFG